MRAGLLGLVLVVVLIGLLVAWVIALVEAATSPRLTSNERLLWLILIALASFVGTILWFAIGRNQGTAVTPGWPDAPAGRPAGPPPAGTFGPARTPDEH
ncbi:PLDc N-terminal domain-containing protein [Luteimicrobium subarcticum]|uniref:Phospholipase D-like protein n=1 Tax=Luteimicrobium subarcticum TaxID=620910 RepID=A0A2M8WSG2_9MICO|nr:PLDc N-terminal domain-containing protein [Luteimicrobium subarcticum]PJI93776.1 phospholipase D-like protein [Luteimicrobium subarcticum]